MQNKEVQSYWNLRVTVLRATNSCRHDYWSESDCYVTLHLPTASARIHRTKTVDNSRTPEWNETFYFRVQSHVKNVLEIRVYDEDTIFDADDLCSIVLFDIHNLTCGTKETKVFHRGAEGKDELHVEFEMHDSEDPPCEYLSNGVLLAAPFSAVDVKLVNAAFKTDTVLKLCGAYHESQKIDHLKDKMEKTWRFYVNRDLETELGVVDHVEETKDSNVIHTCKSAVQIKPLPAKHNCTMALPVGKETVDVELTTDDSPDNGIGVRMDFDIPVQEKAFLEKRKVVVGQALQKVLNLASPPEPKKVPVIAVIASGGGTRAMTGTFGGLRGLQRIGLLDVVSYFTGVSGSTWAMSTLYEDPYWSHCDMEEPISAMEAEITKSLRTAFSLEKLRYYKSEMRKREEEGHLVSLIDMWGLVIEHLTHGKKKYSGTLSDQQRAVSEGQNPLPIYTAVNMKEGQKGITMEAEWCEFTPYEVGISKYGAFIPTEDFGSEFYLGRMIKKLPESRLPHLIGIWSSAFSLNLTQLWIGLTGVAPSWSPWLGEDVSNIESDNEPTTLDTYLLTPITETASAITNFFKGRPVVAKIYNFLRGFYLHYNYNKHDNFNAWKDVHPDAFPNKLTPTDAKLQLVDAGHAINIGCPPVLRSQRGVDVILTLSYSWDLHHVLNVLQETDCYCKDHKIPFPNIDFAKVESEPLKELYVFEDLENPRAPIVVHLPLVNVSFKEFKAPGVAREGDEEMKAGDVDVSTGSSPFRTQKLTYTAENFRKMVDLATYNVVNNEEGILKALRRALERKVPVEEGVSHEQHCCN